MRLSRDVRKQGKSLFRACLVDGALDEARARHAAKLIAQQKPRNAAAILTWFRKLVKIEINKRTLSVQSAIPLADEGESVFQNAEKQFGPALQKLYRVNPGLVGGLRVQIGSSVWDGSILQRLQTLQSFKS